MLDLLLYGTIIIISTSITSIGIVIGMYYLFTKSRKDFGNKHNRKNLEKYTLHEQKEI